MVSQGFWTGTWDRSWGQQWGRSWPGKGNQGQLGQGAGAGGPAARRSQAVQEPSTVLTSVLLLVEFNCLAKHTRPQGHLLS